MVYSREKRNYYNNKSDQCKGDSKKTWNIINNVINKQKSKSIPAYMTIDDNRVEDQFSIANQFNHYFGKIGSAMASTIETGPNN